MEQNRLKINECTHHGNIEARSRNDCCCGNTYYYISECMSVAFVIQHAKRMGRIILSSMACSVLQYFITLSNERHEFIKINIEHNFFFIFFTTFLKNISQSRE
jgi:hypothetical protein